MKNNYKPVMLVTCAAASFVPLMGSALNLALPNINSEFSLSATASGWIATSYILSTAIFQIPCARLADIVGRRKVFIAGIALFLLFSLLSGLATTGTMLIAFRALSGIGSAMIFSTNVAILTSAVPAEKRGWALGINTAVVYFSLAAGPFVGGLMTQSVGWQGIFFLAAAMSLPVLAGAIFVIRDNWKSPDGHKFDLTGAAIYAVGLSVLIYGFSRLPQLVGIILTVAGMAILVLFAWYEKRVDQPVFDIRAFLSNRVFKHASISALINYSATTSIAFMLSLYLQYVRGLSPMQAGTVLVAQSLVMALASLVSGRLSDRFPARRMASLGMLIISIGLISLCFLGGTTSFYYIFGVLGVIGLGFGLFSSPNMNVIMSSVDKTQYGLASATTGTMRLVGQAFSMGLAMMSISLMIGNAAITPEVHGGLIDAIRITFVISSALCLFGVYSSSVKKKQQTPKTEK